MHINAHTEIKLRKSSAAIQVLTLIKNIKNIKNKSIFILLKTNPLLWK